MVSRQHFCENQPNFFLPFSQALEPSNAHPHVDASGFCFNIRLTLIQAVILSLWHRLRRPSLLFMLLGLVILRSLFENNYPTMTSPWFFNDHLVYSQWILLLDSITFSTSPTGSLGSFLPPLEDCTFQEQFHNLCSLIQQNLMCDVCILGVCWIEREDSGERAQEDLRFRNVSGRTQELRTWDAMSC